MTKIPLTFCNTSISWAFNFHTRSYQGSALPKGNFLRYLTGFNNNILNHGLHQGVILEWPGLERILKIIQLLVTFCQTMLFKTPSSLALNPSMDGTSTTTRHMTWNDQVQLYDYNNILYNYNCMIQFYEYNSREIEISKKYLNAFNAMLSIKARGTLICLQCLSLPEYWSLTFLLATYRTAVNSKGKLIFLL